MALTRPRANQINTVITNVTDPLIVLNNGSTSANIDIGLIMNRNSGSIANVALFWDESANTFVTAYTSDSGIINSNVSISQYANLKVHSIFGNLITDGDEIQGALFVDNSVLNLEAGTSNLRIYSSNNVAISSNGVANVIVIGNNTTTLTGNLLPSANVTYDLGSPSQRWREGWFSGNTIHIGNESMSVSADGKWSFTSGGARVDLGANTDFNPPRINSSGNVSAAHFNFANGVSIISTMSASMAAANTAMKGYVDQTITNLVNGAPSTLDTLQEISTALGNDANLSVTLTTYISNVNANIGSANTAMKGYVDGQFLILTSNTAAQSSNIATLFANAAAQSGAIASTNTAIVTANTAMKGYVDNGLSTRASLSGAIFTGAVHATELFVTQSSGEEGGQINLAPSQTNNILSGNVIIDIWNNRLRIFESGGTNRGGFFDLASASGSVGTNLGAGGGGAALDGSTNITGNISPSIGNLFSLGNNTNRMNSIYAASFIGDGSQLTGLPAGYTNSNVADYLPTYTGRVSGSSFTYANGQSILDNVMTAWQANAAAQAGDIATLFANAAAQSGDIATLTSNAAVQAGDIAALFANAAAQSDDLATIFANLGAVSGSISILTANTGSQLSDLATLTSNAAVQAGNIATIFANLGAVSGSIATLTSNAATQSGNIATLFANAATQAGSIATLTSSKANIANPVFTNNVTVQGNLNISGNLITTNVDNLQIDDSLIYLAKNNNSDFLDIGLVSSFTRNSFYQHAGIVRDASDGYWKFFANVESAPTTTIDFGSATYSPVLAGNIVAAGNVVVGANLRIAGALLNSAGDSGASGQYLTSTGTGLAWTSIESSSIADSEDNSSVVATGDYVNISVNGNTVMSARDDSVAVSNLTLVSPTGDGAILSSPGDLHTWKLSASFAVGAQETAPTGIAFKADGTACYIVGSTGDDITQYSLSTPWDISTASFVTQSINLVDTVPDDLFFRPNGLKVYVIGSTNDAVREYDLGTAWDISTISFVQEFSVVSQDTVPTGIFFKTDGTKMFIAGNTNDRIYEYNLSTAWNVSTAVFSQFFSVQTQENGLTSLDFNSDGTIMWIVGTSSDSILQYNLSSAWDVSTATYYGKVYIGWQELTPTGIFVELEQNKAYVVGSTADTIFQYDTSATGLYIASDSTYVTGTVDFNNDVATHSRLFGSSYSTWRNDGGTSLGTTGISGTATLSGAVTMSTTTGAINIHTSQTTGVFILGGTGATGAITLGRSTGNQTVGLATGATASGSTKVLDIGTAGLSGSTTNINIGSAVAGSTTAVSINGDTTVSGNVNIAGNLNFTAGGSADVLYLGNKGITGVNALQFNDPGSGEGVSWAGGNLWKIVESPDALSNASGNLQIVQDSTRRLSVRTDGSIDIPGILRLNSGNGVTAIVNGGTNGVGNIGASGAGFNTVFARATSAQYADLAEIYTSDKKYIPGTVVVFGGDKEVTVSTTSHDPAVAGVVSTNPAYLMNDAVEGSAVALQGRVPCRVLGPVSKGDRVVSSDIRGVAERLDMSKYQPGCIIGKSLDYVPNGEIATIEVVVGRV